MEKHPPLPMTPFDILTSSTQLQMMKLMLPYTPPGIQRMLLEAEGVPFLPDGRVDLSRCRWDGATSSSPL